MPEKRFIFFSSGSFKVYENEDDATKDLAEFSLANAIYAALVEGHACEQSARYDFSDPSLYSWSSPFYLFFSSQTAMDNASKNAKDMIGSLQMKYNRGRQAAITNELVDIITGKSTFPHIPFLHIPSGCTSSISFAIFVKLGYIDLPLFFTGASAL